MTIADLVAAELLHEGDKLFMVYGPRGGERKKYEATVLASGSIEVLGKTFSAPSYAALLCLQDAGSSRNTVNGWTTWKVADGKTLAELREALLNKPAPDEV